MRERISELQFAPVAEGTFVFKATREKLIREIQKGHLEGRLVQGKWYIARAELEAAAGRTQPSTKSA